MGLGLKGRFDCGGYQFDFGLGFYPTDFHYESTLVPPPIFHFERLCREQAELNCLSKFDNSFNSQFLMTQADFDRSQSIAKLVDKLHDGQHVYLQTV